MRTLKILVVDDDLSMRRILEIILETFGYDVFTASNGPEALEIYEGSLEIEMNIDLLITDRQMPGMLGEELIRRIKMLNSNIKAIFMSADDDALVIRVGKAAGADAILHKPFNPTSLVGIIEKLFPS